MRVSGRKPGHRSDEIDLGQSKLMNDISDLAGFVGNSAPEFRNLYYLCHIDSPFFALLVNVHHYNKTPAICQSKYPAGCKRDVYKKQSKSIPSWGLPRFIGA